MEESEKVGWNLAQQVLQEIGNLLQGASHNYINGNYAKGFSYLRAVRMRIPELTTIEYNKLITLEKKFSLLNIKAQTKGFTHTTRSGQAYSEMYFLYSEYNDLIIKYLKQYGYLIPPKEDRTSLNR